jgi:hypothetical protein
MKNGTGDTRAGGKGRKGTARGSERRPGPAVAVRPRAFHQGGRCSAPGARATRGIWRAWERLERGEDRKEGAAEGERTAGRETRRAVAGAANNALASRADGGRHSVVDRAGTRVLDGARDHHDGGATSRQGLYKKRQERASRLGVSGRGVGAGSTSTSASDTSGTLGRDCELGRREAR